MRSTWIMGALASSMFVAGCATSGVATDEAQLGRLSMDKKQRVFTAQNNVEVAQANQQMLRQAVKNSQEFQSIAKMDVEAAKKHLEAASKGLTLGESTKNPDMAGLSRTQYDLSQRELNASGAKLEYADKLVKFREAQSDLANTKYDEAQAELALTKAQALEDNGIRPRESMGALSARRDQLKTKVSVGQEKVNALHSDADTSKSAWVNARKSFQVATSRETPNLPSIPEPRPPQPIAPQPMPETPSEGTKAPTGNPNM